MALTTEQQAELEYQTAIETLRATTQASADATRAKLEALRMAKEVLVENRRTQAAADAVEITASAVTTLAADLNTFVNS
jgi:hypothetical protein